MSKKLSLQEATVLSLYNELTDERDTTDGVDGIMDGVIVVTDPEIDTEQYNELIDRADELVEDTPEGEIPMSEDYLGQFVQLCPICGTTFINKDMLEPGSACPICYETPQSFVMLGKLASKDDVEEDIKLTDAGLEKEPQDETDNVEEPKPEPTDLEEPDEESEE